MWDGSILSAKTVGIITPPLSFNRVGKAVFFYLVALAKEVVWWILDKALIALFKFYLKRILRLKSEVLSSNEITER